VTNHVSSKSSQEFRDSIKLSLNPRIGVLPPGMINNYNIVNEQEPPSSRKYIREMLVNEIDFRIVSKEVWLRLTTIYKGGP
jgi:DUSP domain